jgi:hypothetical protein
LLTLTFGEVSNARFAKLSTKTPYLIQRLGKISVF